MAHCAGQVFSTWEGFLRFLGGSKWLGVRCHRHQHVVGWYCRDPGVLLFRERLSVIQIGGVSLVLSGALLLHLYG